MAKNKGIFDADILIHICNTNMLDILFDYFECIYISDYVFKAEIKTNSKVEKLIEKKINTGKIKILEFNKMTKIQKTIYKESYNVLKSQVDVDNIDEGERITAAFANAHKVNYYMSDDNKAAPFIRINAGLEIINYCDLLYIILILGEDIKILNNFYKDFVSLYDENKIPKILKNRENSLMKFPEVMMMCKIKFDKNQKLTNFLNSFYKER